MLAGLFCHIHRSLYHINRSLLTRALAAGREAKVQPNIPIFGEGFSDGDIPVRGCRPVIEVVSKGRLVYSTLHQQATPAFLDEKEHDVMSFTLASAGTQGVSLMGDVLITCYHVELKSDNDMPGLSGEEYSEDSVDKKIIFRYCFHTGFVSPQPFRLHASELDILPGDLLPTGASVPDDLIVDCVVGPAVAADGGSSAEEEVSLFPKFERCIEDMSALHTVDADPKKVEDLENRDVDGKVAVFALQRTNNDLDEAYQIHSIFRMEEDDVDQSTDSATKRPGGFGT